MSYQIKSVTAFVVIAQRDQALGHPENLSLQITNLVYPLVFSRYTTLTIRSINNQLAFIGYRASSRQAFNLSQYSLQLAIYFLTSRYILFQKYRAARQAYMLSLLWCLTSLYRALSSSVQFSSESITNYSRKVLVVFLHSCQS